MILIKNFECYRNGKYQVLEVKCNVHDRDDIGCLTYDDYEVNLYINRKFVSEISHLLDKADMFCKLIDDIDWYEVYAETKASELEYRRTA